MSTTTDPRKTQAPEQATATIAWQTRTRGWLLMVQVFVAGAVSLAIEMAASRLLAPNFGSSLFVWASLIGLILLYLTIGYYLGGRLADRYPRTQVLYIITLLAALLTGIVPLIAQPVLDWSLHLFANSPLVIFYGSLLSVIVLFALPMILLGCVSPYAIRLRINQLGSAGRTAGMLYAISTAGSIVGTFLPVLVLLPDIGTRATFFSAALTLALLSIVGLLTNPKPMA